MIFYWWYLVAHYLLTQQVSSSLCPKVGLFANDIFFWSYIGDNLHWWSFIGDIWWLTVRTHGRHVFPLVSQGGTFCAWFKHSHPPLLSPQAPQRWGACTMHNAAEAQLTAKCTMQSAAETLAQCIVMVVHLSLLYIFRHLFAVFWGKWQRKAFILMQ